MSDEAIRKRQRVSKPWSKIWSSVRAPRARKASFSDIVPAASMPIVSLEEIAFVILRSLAAVPANNTVMRDMLISSWASSYPRDSRAQAERRLIEAWQMLERLGLIAQRKIHGTFESWFVTEKGQLVKQPTALAYGSQELLPDGLVTACLWTTAIPLYLAGRYEEACTAAFKQLEISVRELGGFSDDIAGVDLMRQAFKPDVGPLTDLSASTAEQLGARDLFAGVMAYYRNPLAHRHIGIKSAAQAASVILLANELIVLAHAHKRARDAKGKESLPTNVGDP